MQNRPKTLAVKASIAMFRFMTSSRRRKRERTSLSVATADGLERLAIHPSWALCSAIARPNKRVDHTQEIVSKFLMPRETRIAPRRCLKNTRQPFDGCAKVNLVQLSASRPSPSHWRPRSAARLPRHEPTKRVLSSLRELQLSPFLFQQIPSFQALNGKPIHFTLENLTFGDVLYSEPLRRTEA